MLIFSTVTHAQCTDGVELMVDGHLVFDGTTLYRPVGDSFVVRCRRCEGGNAPKWTALSGDNIPNCGDDNMRCTESNKLYQDLRFSSFTDSLAGEYRCSRRFNGSITISVLG